MPLLASGRKKRWSYSSLFFSSFFFVPLVLSMPLPLSLWLYQIIGYACFVTIYIAAINKPHHQLPYYLSALVILAYALSFQNPGGAVIFGFVAFIIGYYYSLQKGLVFIVAIALSLALLQLLVLQSKGLYLLAATINSAVLFGFGAMERRETLFQLKEAKHAESMQTLSAIAERERIGRDLHDVAGHALSSISLKAQLADKLLDKQEIALAQKEVKALARLSQELLSDIRHAVSNIKHLTLSDELAKNVALLEENGFDVKSDILLSVEHSLSSLEESQVSLIIKELTTNTLRHSKGKRVALSIDIQNDAFILSYQDIGNHALKPSVIEGNGLTGIRERASSIGASVEFSHSQHMVFSCLLTLPIKPLA
jgi:two-component system sensor histidine kinase DesK